MFHQLATKLTKINDEKKRFRSGKFQGIKIPSSFQFLTLSWVISIQILKGLIKTQFGGICRIIDRKATPGLPKPFNSGLKLLLLKDWKGSFFEAIFTTYLEKAENRDWNLHQFREKSWLQTLKKCFQTQSIISPVKHNFIIFYCTVWSIYTAQ